MLPPTERLRSVFRGDHRWNAFEHRPETTSTNDVVASRAVAGAPPGLVVVADRQTAGRGRRGRPWEDRPGGSLLASELVLPPPERATLLPLAVGLAIAGALEPQGVATQVKWPNDVLLDTGDGPKKCAGVLVEQRSDRGATFVIIGNGLNLDWRGAAAGEAEWTSVAEVTGADVDRWEVLADLLVALDQRLDEVERDPVALLERYRGRASTLGRRVEVTRSADRVVGEAVDVDEDGALLVRDGERLVTVTAGDVVHVAGG